MGAAVEPLTGQDNAPVRAQSGQTYTGKNAGPGEPEARLHAGADALENASDHRLGREWKKPSASCWISAAISEMRAKYSSRSSKVVLG